MVQVNGAYQHDRYEKIWLKSLHIMSNIRVYAMKDSWLNTTDYKDPYLFTRIKNSIPVLRESTKKPKVLPLSSRLILTQTSLWPCVSRALCLKSYCCLKIYHYNDIKPCFSTALYPKPYFCLIFSPWLCLSTALYPKPYYCLQNMFSNSHSSDCVCPRRFTLSLTTVFKTCSHTDIPQTVSVHSALPKALPLSSKHILTQTSLWPCVSKALYLKSYCCLQNISLHGHWTLCLQGTLPQVLLLPSKHITTLTLDLVSTTHSTSSLTAAFKTYHTDIPLTLFLQGTLPKAYCLQNIFWQRYPSDLDFPGHSTQSPFWLCLSKALYPTPCSCLQNILTQPSLWLCLSIVLYPKPYHCLQNITQPPLWLCLSTVLYPKPYHCLQNITQTSPWPCFSRALYPAIPLTVSPRRSTQSLTAVFKTYSHKDIPLTLFLWITLPSHLWLCLSTALYQKPYCCLQNMFSHRHPSDCVCPQRFTQSLTTVFKTSHSQPSDFVCPQRFTQSLTTVFKTSHRQPPDLVSLEHSTQPSL